MANRKRRMKLPNGFGSIKYLGSGRRNPYAAYPPATEWAENGKYQITPKALAYAETWETHMNFSQHTTWKNRERLK